MTHFFVIVIMAPNLVATSLNNSWQRLWVGGFTQRLITIAECANGIITEKARACNAFRF